MKLSRRRKIYYILLFIFLALLIVSYGNIARGGAILWTGPNLFYVAIFVVAASLFYVIASSQSDSLNWVEVFAVGAFCLSLFLVLWVGAGTLPNDPDSIISMRSISFMLENGFSTAQLTQPGFLIGATYSLPMQSLLGAVLALVTKASFITVAKYLPLIIMLILLMIYYALVSTRYSKRASLLSLAALASFPILVSFANVVNNLVLGSTFLFLTLLLISMRNSHNRTVLTALAFVVICIFALTHHLTFLIFLIVLGVLIFKDALVRTRGDYYLRVKRINVMFLVALLLVMFTYYVFAGIGPLKSIIKAFTRQALEVAPVTSVAQWAPAIAIQRAGYILFVAFLIYLSLFAARCDLKRFLSHYANFLVLGGALFLFSIGGAFIGVPYNWERTSIYGWALVIPATFAILLETKSLKRKTLFAISAIVVATFIFCNVFAIPSNWLDHTGSNEYTGSSYKDMTKMQEFDSVVWYVKYRAINSGVVGDEIARRLFLSNSSNFTGSFMDISRYNGTQNGSSIIVRNEDFYQTIQTFYPALGAQGGSRTTTDRDQWTDIVNSNRLYRVYDNAEVRIMYTP